MPHQPHNPDMTYSSAHNSSREGVAIPPIPTPHPEVPKPSPVAQPTIVRQHYLLATYNGGHQPFYSSFVSSPDAPDSLSASSTASYSQPSCLRKYKAQRNSAPSFSLSPDAEQGPLHCRVDSGQGVSEKALRLPPARTPSPIGSTRQVDSTIFTYAQDEEPTPAKEHAIWVAVSLSGGSPVYPTVTKVVTDMSIDPHAILLLRRRYLYSVGIANSHNALTDTILPVRLVATRAAHSFPCPCTQPPSQTDMFLVISNPSESWPRSTERHL